MNFLQCLDKNNAVDLIKNILNNKYQITKQDIKDLANYSKNNKYDYNKKYYGILELVKEYGYWFDEEDYILLIKSNIVLPFVPEPFTQLIFEACVEYRCVPKTIDITKFTYNITQLEELLSNRIKSNKYKNTSISYTDVEVFSKIIEHNKIELTQKCIDNLTINFDPLNYYTRHMIYELLSYFSLYGLLPTNITKDIIQYCNFKKVNVSQYKKYDGPLNQKINDGTKIIKNDTNKHIFELLNIQFDDTIYCYIYEQFSYWCGLNLISIDIKYYFTEEISKILKLPELKETYINKTVISKLLGYILLNTNIDFNNSTIFKIPTVKDNKIQPGIINESVTDLENYINKNNLLIRSKIYFDEFLSNKYEIEQNKYITKANIRKFIIYILNKK